MVEGDVSLCIKRCVHMWLLSPKAEAQVQLHVGHGMPAAWMGAEAALSLQS